MPTAVAYSGPERRAFQRRQNADRRAMVRFELEKAPRRSGKDRRGRVTTEDIWSGRENF